MIEGTEGKTAREFFIALISCGPSKLPISYVLESFDLTMKAYYGDDRKEAILPDLPSIADSGEKAEDGTPISQDAIKQWEVQKNMILTERESKKAAGVGPRVVKDDWREEPDE